MQSLKRASQVCRSSSIVIKQSRSVCIHSLPHQSLHRKPIGNFSQIHTSIEVETGDTHSYTDDDDTIVDAEIIRDSSDDDTNYNRLISMPFVSDLSDLFDTDTNEYIDTQSKLQSITQHSPQLSSADIDAATIEYPSTIDYGPNYRVSFPIDDIIKHLQKNGCDSIKIYDLHLTSFNDALFATTEDKDWLIVCSAYNIPHLERITRATLRQAHYRGVPKDSYYRDVFSSSFGATGETQWCLLDLADTLVLCTTVKLRSDPDSLVSQIENKFFPHFYGVYHTTKVNERETWLREQDRRRRKRVAKKFTDPLLSSPMQTSDDVNERDVDSSDDDAW